MFKADEMVCGREKPFARANLAWPRRRAGKCINGDGHSEDLHFYAEHGAALHLSKIISSLKFLVRGIAFLHCPGDFYGACKQGEECSDAGIPHFGLG
jgi:hypothetical protein